MIQIKILAGVEDAVVAVCRDYWLQREGDDFVYRVADVCKSHEVPQSKLSKILESSCLAQDSEIIYEDCNLLLKLRSRSEWQSLRRQPRWGENNRVCSSCSDFRLQQRKAEEERIRQAKYEAWLAEHARISALATTQFGSPQFLGIDVRQVPFKAAIYLLAVFNHSGDDQFRLLQPLAEASLEKLTPTEELSQGGFESSLRRRVYRNTS